MFNFDLPPRWDSNDNFSDLTKTLVLKNEDSVQIHFDNLVCTLKNLTVDIFRKICLPEIEDLI